MTVPFDEDDYATMECTNITSMEQNGWVLRESKADIQTSQEHKLRKRDMAKIRKRLKEAGWSIHCTPCDESGSRPAAGVGVMWRDDQVKIYPEKIKDEDNRADGLTKQVKQELAQRYSKSTYVILGSDRAKASVELAKQG